MDYFIGFILGLLACGFLWALRELERRQAFEDAAEQVERLRRRELRYRSTIDNIKALAMRTHIERIQRLGGMALLPAPAEFEGQHSSQRITARLKGISGPSNGGPIFNGRRP